jgi:hypothetical protein
VQVGLIWLRMGTSGREHKLVEIGPADLPLVTETRLYSMRHS